MTITITKTITRDVKDGVTEPYVPGKMPSWGNRLGTVHTQVVVDEPVEVTLDPEQAEAVVVALLSSKAFKRGAYGAQPTSEQRRAAEQIRSVLVAMGVPTETIARRSVRP